MAHKFAEIAFTPGVREIQVARGSREGYARMDQGEDYNYLLGERESGFIAERDSFYMASVSESGWPYVQHRGGPAGFMKVLDERSIGFADYSGNRQYVSTGNFMHDDRVALFFMDYPNRRRLKMLGRVELVETHDYETLARLEDDDYRVQVERGFVIRVEAFDWNCPQHITPRYSETAVEEMLEKLTEENRRMKAGSAAHAAVVANDEPANPKAMAPSERTPAVLGDGPLELVVSGVRQLAPRVRAFELRDPGGAELPPVEPGSHLRVPVRLANGDLIERYYSIASNPARRDVYEIAVLREEQGTGGSRAVHDSYGIGTGLRVDLPGNHFAVHGDSRPSVLIAGGIGITPIKSIVQAMADGEADFHLHYAGRSRGEMAFRDRLERQLEGQISIYSSADGERMDIDNTLATAPADAVFYVCGPERLIGAVLDAAKKAGIDAERVRFERFI